MKKLGLVWLSDDAEEVGTVPLPTDGPPESVDKGKSQLQDLAPLVLLWLIGDMPYPTKIGTLLAHRGYALPQEKGNLVHEAWHHRKTAGGKASQRSSGLWSVPPMTGKSARKVTVDKTI